jgi:hypothetical protein
VGKLALILLLLGILNPGAAIEVEGNTITMDRNDGSAVVVIEVKEGEPAKITLEDDEDEVTEDEEATEEADEAK